MTSGLHIHHNIIIVNGRICSLQARRIASSVETALRWARDPDAPYGARRRESDVGRRGDRRSSALSQGLATVGYEPASKIQSDMYQQRSAKCLKIRTVESWLTEPPGRPQQIAYNPWTGGLGRCRTGRTKSPHGQFAKGAILGEPMTRRYLVLSSPVNTALT